MMADNPISGHTAGTNDGLRDGDHILSPSLTNIYEGLHGNGILLASDTAYADGDRNNPIALPGAIAAGADASKVTVSAHSVILDGVLYTRAATPVEFTSSHSTKLTGSTTTALTDGKECLFVVLSTSLGVKWVQTTPITTTAGAYASISGAIADAYLKMDGVTAADNKQSIVLGVVRATCTSAASGVGDLKIQAQSERNDKRVFIRPSPFYLSPVTSGAVGATTEVNDHTALAQIHGTGEHGDFGNNGVLWLSYNRDENLPNLYFSAKDGSNRHTHLLGPNRIQSLTGAHSFEFDDAQVFLYTGGSTKNLTPTGTFPPGHTVIVVVESGGAVTFDPSVLNNTLSATDSAMFVYTGSAWKKIVASSTVLHTASGATGLVQLSDGSGGHTSDAKLFWTSGSSTLTVNGKLTVTGLIDPTGLELTPIGSNPGGTGTNTLWLDSGASNALKHGTATILNTGSSVADLSDVSAVGSGSIISTAERNKLNAVEASADVTDATNVRSAIEGMTINAPATSIDGTNDKILLIDNSASAGAILTEDTIANVVTASGMIGTVTSIATSAPISGGTITGSGAISITAATTSAAGSMSGADKTKLDAIEANADVTDATNVNAAGAIMHSDVGTKGDLIAGDGAGDATILGVGTNNHVLTADSSETSGVKWAAASSGGITALTGNVTASGSGSVAATIADEAVTYAKMQHVSATSRVLGRITSGAGDVEELTAANLRTILTVADGSLSENNFTNADHTKLNGIAASAVDAAGAISAVEGEATLALAGSVTVAAGQTFVAPRLPTVAVSASTTLTEATHAGRYNICAGNITLPATSTAGEHYTVLNTTGGNITVGRNSNNINGAASDATIGTYNGATFIAIGSNNWLALGV